MVRQVTLLSLETGNRQSCLNFHDSSIGSKTITSKADSVNQVRTRRVHGWGLVFAAFGPHSAHDAKRAIRYPQSIPQRPVRAPLQKPKCPDVRISSTRDWNGRFMAR